MRQKEQHQDVMRRRREISREELDKTRTHLLIASTIGFVISITGAVPTKIETLGVTFSPFDRVWFFVFVSLIVFYFLVKFIIARYKWDRDIKPFDDEARGLVGEAPKPAWFSYFRLNLADRPLIDTLSRYFDTWLPGIFGAAAFLVCVLAVVLPLALSFFRALTD